jgi:hypothetical protein
MDTDCPKFDVEIKRVLCFYKYNTMEARGVVSGGIIPYF